jgi:hypothetical protein
VRSILKDDIPELRIEEVLRRERNLLLDELAAGPLDILRPPSITEGIGLRLPVGRHLADGHGHGLWRLAKFM